MEHEKNAFVMVPSNQLERIERELYQLRRSLDATHTFSKGLEKEWLPKLEFQEIVSIRNTKFHEIHSKIPAHLTKRIGRKLYVHRDVVQLYFNQELLPNGREVK